MAVANRLNKTAPQPKKDAVAIFEANGMEVKLTPTIVKNYLVSGDKDRVTDQEVAMFINLCKYSGLNPWLREAYCIKYGSEPATMVTGKDAFMKRAEAMPDYDGMQAGIVVTDQEGSINYREGSVKLPGEEIIGGWAEVYRKDRQHSTRVEVSFEEYAARRKDGSLNSQWSKKPATMIRKVAVVQALREAFPTNLGGMYSAEEVGREEPEEAGMPAAPMNPETGEVMDAEIVEKKEAVKKAEPAPESSVEDLI
ncbi:MAG: phage recombination protein Bet [Solobacterium sp.]|nr:phage recombination protein Bet [Solobacterium sp.]